MLTCRHDVSPSKYPRGWRQISEEFDPLTFMKITSSVSLCEHKNSNEDEFPTLSIDIRTVIHPNTLSLSRCLCARSSDSDEKRESW